MTTAIPAQITADVLEELVEKAIPCGGVKFLSIPPCGSPAKFVLDWRNADHPCIVEQRPSDFKCADCYYLWLDATVQSFMVQGHVTCTECRGYFDMLTEFARYVPL